MSMLLIVDDLKDYCDELAWGLGRDGHQVNIATNAEEAIRLGSLIRPDVLITDWMLEDHIHGLSVSEALRVIRPATKTILMTGYASSDLRSEADQSGVTAFLEKPFPLAGMRAAVKRVEELPAPPEKNLPIGFLEVETGGVITYRNRAAQDLIAARGSSEVKIFRELFQRDAEEDIGRALDGWARVTPRGSGDESLWRIRGRQFSDRGIATYVLLPESSAPYLMGAPVVSRLLGVPDPFPGGFRYSGHVLVVDDSDDVRKVTAEVIRQTGGVCLTAANHAEAIHLFAHDARIGYVLLDYEMPDGTPIALLERIRSLRPQVKTIGCSSGGHSEDFKQLGIHHYLAKPWQMSDLLGVLAEPAADREVADSAY